MAKKIRYKLGIRLTSLITLMLVVIIGFTIVVNYNNEKTVLNEQLQQHGLSLAKAIAISVIEPLLTDDVPVIDTFIEQLINQKSNVIAISVWRADNTLIASLGNTDINQHTHSYIADVSLGTDTDIIGRVEVMLSSLEAEALIYQRLIAAIFAWFLMSLVISLLLFILLKKFVTSPLNHLVAEASLLSDGKLDKAITILGGNEFSFLETTLEEMRVGLVNYKTLHDEQKLELLDNNEKLNTALDKAEIAVKIKSEFLATMSHEIRTPMNGVLGMLSLILDSELSEEQRHQTTVAKSSADSLLLIINDILDFSKVEAGKMELEYIDFDLRSLFSEFSELMAMSAQSKGLELILDIINIEQSMIRCDPGRLRQILTNLVSNAIKFTQQGEVIIFAELIPMAINAQADKMTLHCTITDTGIGIPEDKLEGIFESFSQVDASVTRKYGGTGLGLAIVKKLCVLLGGDITIRSQLGVGCCFDFTIIIENSEKSTLVLPKIDISTLNILIVDDNKSNRDVLRVQLERWGACVTEAEDAQTALKLLSDIVEQKNNLNITINAEIKPLFDVALLDNQMPNMDGTTLCKHIKEDLRLDPMKLVIMSSVSNRGDAKRFADMGVDAFFPKPATTDDLFKALSIVVEDGETLKQADPLVTRHYIKSLSDSDDEIRQQQVMPDALTRSNSRILLVEDNQVNQMVAISILKKLGFQDATVAANGVEALNSLTLAPLDEPFTLILMDCHMPKMDGYEASRQIRAGKAGEQYVTIPIIAITANAMMGDREKCLDAGMDDFVSKPIDIGKIREKVYFWLSARPSNNLVSKTHP